MDRVESVGVGLAMMGIVWGVYSQALPPMVDQRAAPPGEPHSTQQEKIARWTAAGLVGMVSLITMDATVFILGGSAVIAFSWMYRHANFGCDPMGPTSLPSSRNLAAASVSVDGVGGQASVGY